MVGDGYATGVAAEIAQHMLGTAEGRLGIDDPALLLQSFHGRGEQVTVLESECDTASRLLQQFLVHQFATLQRQWIAHTVIDKLAVLMAHDDPCRCQQRKMLRYIRLHRARCGHNLANRLRFYIESLQNLQAHGLAQHAKLSRHFLQFGVGQISQFLGCASPKLHPVIMMTGLLNPPVILERMMRK